MFDKDMWNERSKDPEVIAAWEKARYAAFDLRQLGVRAAPEVKKARKALDEALAKAWEDENKAKHTDR